MKVQSVAECFASYRANVIPKHAPQEQIVECERAFYAGSYFLLMNVAHNIGDDSTSEEEGMAQLEALKRECEEFAGMTQTPLPTVEPPPMVVTENYTTPDARELAPIMKRLGQVLGDALPDGWGFNLLAFTFGTGGNLFYISNAQQEDVLAVMKEFIRKQTQ